MGRKPVLAWMRLYRSGFLDKARKEAASAWKCQSLRSLGLRGLRALAPATMLVGLLSRLRYLKAFGAIAAICNQDSGARVHARRIKTCVFAPIKSAFSCCPWERFRFRLFFRYRQDSAPIDKPHRREFHPRFFFLDIGRIHAYKPISPSPCKVPGIPASMVVCIKRKPAQWRASKRRSGR